MGGITIIACHNLRLCPAPGHDENPLCGQGEGCSAGSRVVNQQHTGCVLGKEDEALRLWDAQNQVFLSHKSSPPLENTAKNFHRKLLTVFLRMLPLPSCLAVTRQLSHCVVEHLVLGRRHRTA